MGGRRSAVEMIADALREIGTVAALFIPLDYAFSDRSATFWHGAWFWNGYDRYLKRIGKAAMTELVASLVLFSGLLASAGFVFLRRERRQARGERLIKIAMVQRERRRA
jgi:hypothetical protein